MKEKELKEILKSKFELVDGKYLPEPWKRVLSLFFKKIDYLSSPSDLFAENDKVLDGKQLGTVRIDDGKQLAVLVIQVDDSVIISRNRQELRKIAIKPIDQNFIHGALAFFYNKNQSDYRFSFIAKESSLDPETGQLVKGETKPKRYTYLLGTNEACTTAAKRMLVLADKREKGEITLADLKEVFSVEALNKDFFKSYKAHYEKFWKHLAHEENPFREQLIDVEKDTKEKQEKPIRDFAKKLLGRIVFLHFLQKKGWMGCPSDTQSWTGGDPRFMQSLYESFEPKKEFHSRCLTKLFFQTLNSVRANGIFKMEGLSGKLNGSRVPYLNGGLFEPEKNRTTLKIDFPPDFFKELLEFFDQYNFTIDENSPEDHEVGIDPEMLGHIFENLLEDNRDKGAFYTPKEIVQYMCKESLIQYLLNTFREKKDIEQFVRIHTVSPFLAERENSQLLNRKLDEIKVCDPAIGSGAFPIGMLQEIFEAKRFIYPYLKTTQPFNPAEVKKNIIQNSIYGVDMEKGAVDIAQLRFWLALVVEEENPHPLPNLDYKIMQGDSLLEQYEGIDLSQIGISKGDVQIVEPEADLFGYVKEPQYKFTYSKSELREKIDELISDFFFIENPERKKSIREQINKLVLEHIEYNIDKREYQLNRFINEAGKVQNLSKAARKKYDEYVRDLFRIQDTKQRLIKIQETDERPYFLWHLYFKDLMEKGGFDVMIGNPPYIQLQKMGGYTDVLQEVGFETFARTGDIYCLFYEKGFNLLKPGGVLTYITSNKWMRGGYGRSLRNYFTTVNTQKIINLGPGIFHSATVDTNIYVGKKEPFTNSVKGIAIDSRTDISYLREEELIPMQDVNEDAWVVLDEADLQISKAFETFGRPLREWDINILRGVLTGFNEAFIIDEESKIDLIWKEPKSAELIKPILKGREIERYFTIWTNDYILNTHNGYKSSTGSYIKPIDVRSDFSAIWEYLFSAEEKLKKEKALDPRVKLISERADQGWHWTNLRNCAYLDEFKKEKVIWKRIGSIMRFAYSDEEMYCLDSTCIATGEKIKYLTAILNSKAGLFQLFKTSPQTGTGDQIISVQALEPLLVHYPTDEVESKFNLMVDYILFIRKSKEQLFQYVTNEHVSGFFEEIIDLMVYELYFEEEMKSKSIDVLELISKRSFPDITQSEDPKSLVQKVFYELQQKDNPIRNRILVSSVRSETIARINAATR